MAKKGSSYKVTKKIQTGTKLNAYAATKCVAEVTTQGAGVSSATAFSVAGWERAKLECVVTPKSAAAQMKGAVVFQFGASLDGTNYNTHMTKAQNISNAYKSVTMIKSAGSATITLRRIISCDVAGLAAIKLLEVANSGSGAVGVNAHLVKAR